jgi:cytochrome c5
MHRIKPAIVASALLACLLTAALVAQAPATPAATAEAALHSPPQTPSDAAARAVLDKYCVTCHNARLKTAGLLLDRMDAAHVGDAAETWEKVARKLRTHEMPPPGASRPDAATYGSMTNWLETALDQASAASPRPGRIPVHRLNRTEYANAIRDLLAVEVDARALLSADEPDQHGFDNVASVLSVSPALLENYLSAASTVSRLAVGDPTINPVVDLFKIPTALVQDDRTNEALPFGSRGGAVVRYQFPLDGEYTIKVVLKRQLYLYLMGMGESHQLDVRLDGVLLKRFTIGGEGKGMTAPESFAGNTQGGTRSASARQGRRPGRGRVVRQPAVGTRRRSATPAARFRPDDERGVLRQPGGGDHLRRWPI